MIRLFSTFSNNIGLLQYYVGDQNMGASSEHGRPEHGSFITSCSFTEGSVLFCNEQNNQTFSESKQIY